MEQLQQRSISSIRKHHPDLPIHTIRLPDNSTYLDKARMYADSPFDVTAFLDLDTVIFGKLDYAFEQAEKFGLACCINESPWARRYSGCMKGDAIEYNAGVMFFDKIKSKPLFDAWLACVNQIDSSSRFKTLEGIKRQLCNDQAGLAKAVEDTGFNPKILPQNWNFRPFWQRSVVGPLKIWHDYDNPPARMIEYSEGAQEEVIFDTIYLDNQPGQDELEPAGKKIKVACAMSVPRLGFQDNFFCISEALTPLGIKPVHYDGVFWGQCLERVMGEQLDADWILSIDYDSVFKRKDVESLISLAARSDFADAIAAVQLRRKTHDLLIAIKGEKGNLRPQIGIDALEPDLLECHVAHFGLTMFRVSALKKMTHPWFLNVPDEKGEWGEQKQDEDIYFWRKWRATGNTLYMANHVVTGHIESMIAWPDENMDCTFQHPCDFWTDGKPEKVWK